MLRTQAQISCRKCVTMVDRVMPVLVLKLTENRNSRPSVVKEHAFVTGITGNEAFLEMLEVLAGIVGST